MRTYDKLTLEQQTKAVDLQATQLLEALIDGGIRFSDSLNEDDLQARIDTAIAKAETMQTPWFAHEYIMAACRDEIMGMAQATAEEAMYRDLKDAQVVTIR
jgi:tRNA splicing endonuclease